MCKAQPPAGSGRGQLECWRELAPTCRLGDSQHFVCEASTPAMFGGSSDDDDGERVSTMPVATPSSPTRVSSVPTSRPAAPAMQRVTCSFWDSESEDESRRKGGWNPFAFMTTTTVNEGRQDTTDDTTMANVEEDEEAQKEGERGAEEADEASDHRSAAAAVDEQEVVRSEDESTTDGESGGGAGGSASDDSTTDDEGRSQGSAQSCAGKLSAAREVERVVVRDGTARHAAGKGERKAAAVRCRRRDDERDEEEDEAEEDRREARRQRDIKRRKAVKRERPCPRRVAQLDDDDDADSDIDCNEIYPLSLKKVVHYGTEEPLVLEERDKDDGTKEVVCAVPWAANRYLQDYQKRGIRFMYQHYLAKQGCILGDEMGLGKTVQVVCFLLAVLGKKGTQQDKDDTMNRRMAIRRGLMEKRPGTAVLIVGPATVRSSWAEHLAIFGHFSVFSMLGKRADECRDAIRQAGDGAMEIIITSYAGMQGTYRKNLADVKWRCVIFDEIHFLKNHNTSLWNCARALKSKVKIGLTGTPIQNNLEELWSLLSICVPREVQERSEFVQYFSMPMKRSKKRTADDEIKERGIQRQAELHVLLDRVLIQRTKVLIKDKLKSKKEHVVFCNLTDLQYRAYDRILAMPEFQLLKHLRDPCSCNSGEIRGKCCYRYPRLDDRSRQIHPDAVLWQSLHPDGSMCDTCPFCLQLACISKLQKVANHPALLQVDPGERDRVKRGYAEGFARVAFGEKGLKEMGGVERSSHVMEVIKEERSGKMVALRRLLFKFKNERRRVLVFSYSVQTLNIMEAMAKLHYWRYVRLDGSTAGVARQGIIDEFQTNESIFIFFISTKAGGLGLNLTAASRVVIYDVHWNPSMDMQAQDRAFRLGQLQDVEVYRLLSQGTIEELCYMRQIYKRQLQNLAIGEQDGVSEHGTEMERKRVEGVAFDSVQGSKGEEGELFGLNNLLQLSRNSILQELRASLEKGDAGPADQFVEPKTAEDIENTIIGAATSRAAALNDIEASADQLFQLLGGKDEEIAALAKEALKAKERDLEALEEAERKRVGEEGRTAEGGVKVYRGCVDDAGDGGGGSGGNGGGSTSQRGRAHASSSKKSPSTASSSSSSTSSTKRSRGGGGEEQLQHQKMNTSTSPSAQKSPPPLSQSRIMDVSSDDDAAEQATEKKGVKQTPQEKKGANSPSAKSTGSASTERYKHSASAASHFAVAVKPSGDGVGGAASAGAAAANGKPKLKLRLPNYTKRG